MLFLPNHTRNSEPFLLTEPHRWVLADSFWLQTTNKRLYPHLQLHQHATSFSSNLTHLSPVKLTIFFVFKPGRNCTPWYALLICDIFIWHPLFQVLDSLTFLNNSFISQLALIWRHIDWLRCCTSNARVYKFLSLNLHTYNILTNYITCSNWTKKKTSEYFLNAKKRAETKSECCSAVNNISGDFPKEKSKMDSSLHAWGRFPQNINPRIRNCISYHGISQMQEYLNSFCRWKINTPNGTRKRFGHRRSSSDEERLSGCSYDDDGER